MLKHAVFVLIVMFPLKALSHSPLTSVNPSDGSNLRISPSSIVMKFKSPAKLIRLDLSLVNDEASSSFFKSLFDSANSELVPLEKDFLLQMGKRHEISLPLLKNGSYVASWRAMSVDGHVIKGEFSFQILEE